MSKRRINFDDPVLDHYTSNQLRKIADYSMRKHLLSRWDGRCFLTGREIGEQDVHVAHYRDRAYMPLRYSVDNLKLINRWSNTFDSRVYDKALYGPLSKHHFEYRGGLINLHGLEYVEWLEGDHERILFTKEKLIKVIEDARIL